MQTKPFLAIPLLCLFVGCERPATKPIPQPASPPSKVPEPWLQPRPVGLTEKEKAIKELLLRKIAQKRARERDNDEHELHLITERMRAAAGNQPRFRASRVGEYTEYFMIGLREAFKDATPEDVMIAMRNMGITP
jgi:hypothetical protein